MDRYSVLKFIFGIVCALLFIWAVKKSVPPPPCKQSEIRVDGKCVPNVNLPTCAPTKTEEDKNADIYRLSEDNKCLPSMCKNGYMLSLKNACVPLSPDNAAPDREQVSKFLNSESNSTDRMFIDLGNDFNLDTVVTKFLNYEECNKGNMLGCAKNFVDYCDNNPTGQKYSVDCSQIVGNLGPKCATTADCGEMSTLKCKRTPDGSKSYCA